MLKAGEIAVGQARLENGKLTAGDVVDLLAIFRLWLGERAAEFSDLEQKLVAAVSPQAERLAGVLVLLQVQGFDMSELGGGGLPVAAKANDRRLLMVQYAFGLLYDNPGLGPHGGHGLRFATSRSVRTRVIYQ